MSYAQGKASLLGPMSDVRGGLYSEGQCIINLCIGTFIKMCFIFPKKYFIFAKLHCVLLYFCTKKSYDLCI